MNMEIACVFFRLEVKKKKAKILKTNRRNLHSGYMNVIFPYENRGGGKGSELCSEALFGSGFGFILSCFFGVRRIFRDLLFLILSSFCDCILKSH